MKSLLLALAFCGHAFAQSITIPAQTISAPFVVNGVAHTINVVIPAQTVALPATTSGLPAGMAYSPASGLSVTGPITATGQVSATAVSLTGGAVLPTCTSGLYLFQLTAGVLAPACYTLPPVTVSQADPTVNAFTFNP